MTQLKTNEDRVSLSLLADVVSRRKFDRQRLLVSAELCCPPDFPAFAGHFPGQPVLPAVIQLAVVRMLAGEIIDQPLQPEKTERVKFKNMIRPDEKVFVEVELKAVAEKWQADFRLRNDRDTIAAGKLLLRESGG
ncbi:MAG: beta-hydroxyacyl-ACP dehydratase [Thermodesulfobacteriota bacterium]